MICKVCNSKQECSICEKAYERNTLSLLTINCDLEDFIYSNRKKLIIKSEDSVTYYICINCVKNILNVI